MIYLDHHATTPLLPEALDAMLPYLRGEFGNAASRTHAYGERAAKAVETARARVAAAIGAEDPREITFTSADSYTGVISFTAEGTSVTVNLSGTKIGDCDNPVG